MKESVSANTTYSGKLLARNTIYNLLGYGIPVIVALVLIPPLIKGLGDERFGILNLAWIVVGYFSFLDFGIGRALTKIIAEKITLNQEAEIPGIFWTSFLLMTIVSVIGMFIFIALTPLLVYKFFNISYKLQAETLNTFYILAVSIPIVTTTAGIRGALEAYQEFGIINIIRIILGIFSFLGPLLCLFFTNNLFWIILFLVIVRIVVWLLYLIQCFKLNPDIKAKLSFQIGLIKPILKFSSWITVSNFIVPLIVYIDRFLIGALASAAAITYYATPYEAVTKLLLIPGALTGVLFPAFSASYLNNPEFTKKLSIRAMKYIFIIIYPIVILIITFANEGMRLWLGQKFAENSSFILQLLAAGVLFNCVAYIPFTFLQGIGKPDITAKVNLLELPPYVLAMWFAIKQFGINGAAFVWFLRMVIDTMILFWFTYKQVISNTKFHFNFSYLLILVLIVSSLLPIIISNLIAKSLVISIILCVFLIVSWKFLLMEEEKIFLMSRIKKII